MSRSARQDRVAAHRRSARTIAAVGASVAALLLSGCAAGQIAQTAQQGAAIDGADATAGDIGVRNVLVATPDAANYPAGADAELLFVVSNDGAEADTLTKISSPAAGSVELSDQMQIAPMSLSYVGDIVEAQEPDATATLTGLTDAFCYGKAIPVTFSFANAGQITVQVPIEIPAERTGARPTIEILPPHPTPVWEEGEHAAEAAAEHGSAGESPAESASAAASAAPATACNG